MNFLNFVLFFGICVSSLCGISVPFIYVKYLKRRAIDIIDKAGPKDDCSRHLKLWIGDLFNFKKLWALQMLDASAKPQTGILTGNILHWGNYDECLKIREDKGTDGVIEGQYCTIALLPIKNATSDIAQILDIVNFLPDVMRIEEGKDLKNFLRIFKVLYGVCLPKSCTPDKIQKLWDYMEHTFRLPVHVSLDANFCSQKGKVPHAFYFDKYVIWIFGLLFFAIFLATVYDIIVCRKLQEASENFWTKILIAFSVHRNLKSIFQYPSAHNGNNLSCVNGIKVLSMLWVIFGHRHMFGFLTGTLNMLDYFEWRKGLVGLVILLAPFAVDNFLTISGLLLAYKYMEIRDMLPANQSMPYFMFYFLRFLRLWPALLATIMIYTSIIKYLTSGPLWTMTSYRMSNACASTGWLTALFMTNLVDFKYQCLEPAWYLAVDTQLYCIAPLLLYFLHRSPKRTTFVLISISLVSALYAYIVTVNTKVKWTPSEADEQYMRLYQSTFVRMPSWILGLLAGVIIYKFQQYRIPKVLAAFIWTCIIIIILGIAWVTNTMISNRYNEYSAGLYNALTRPAWSLAICSLISLCATGHGGFINKLLSLNIFHVIVKFSYSTFLLHVAVIFIIGGNKRTTAFFNPFTILHAFLGDLPFIFAASLVWCLAFESPFINIAKILIESGNSSFGTLGTYNKKRLSKSYFKDRAVVKYLPKDKQNIKKKRS